jgi:hypothetical protein
MKDLIAKKIDFKCQGSKLKEKSVNPPNLGIDDGAEEDQIELITQEP